MSLIPFPIGRDKLQDVENDIRKLIRLNAKNVIHIYAVQRSVTKSGLPVRLSILLEKAPSLTLDGLLRDCESLREERVTVCNTVHNTIASNRSKFLLL